MAKKNPDIKKSKGLFAEAMVRLRRNKGAMIGLSIFLIIVLIALLSPVFFDYEQDGVLDHVGIVESCDGRIVTTIEGNSGNACRRNS